MTTTTRTEAPHHNTLTCYTDYNCRRDPCVTRYNDWHRGRQRALAAGTWQPLVDATPVREHLLKLHAAGITPYRVEVLTGIDWNTIRLYTQPVVHQGRGMIRRISRENQAKILAIQPEPTLPGRVDPTGTRRRIQALCAIGWPLKELGPHINIEPEYVRHILKRINQVYGTTAQATTNAYERLRDDNPRKHGISETSIKRALRHSKQNRWAPPKYWDQHPGAIDDPHFEPMYRLSRIEIVAEDATWLLNAGYSLDTIAQRFNVTRGYVEDAIRKTNKRTYQEAA
ncbi:hypothetical protein ACWELB_20900 [Streptomyces asiaticus]